MPGSASLLTGQSGPEEQATAVMTAQSWSRWKLAATRNRLPVIIFFYRAYLRTSGGGQTDGFPGRSRSSAREPTWWRSSSTGPAGPKAQQKDMALSGEPSTYLFILKHVSDSHWLFDDIAQVLSM